MGTMKKRINNKIYNTETSKKICTYFEHGIQGYNWMYNEEFYIKRNGELFIWYNGDIYTDGILELLKERLESKNTYTTLQSNGQYTTPFCEVYEDKLIRQLTDNITVITMEEIIASNMEENNILK